jgi:hypothetical protein
MANWVISCKNCSAEFTRSSIDDDKTMLSFLLPTKPEFPDGGSLLECPGCGNQATYQGTDLVYRG